jgi:hypothetical protein
VRTLTHNRSLQAILLGSLITIASVFFEYARMAPDYRFLVEPWSIRGHSLTQGWVMVAVAAAIALIGLAVAYGLIKETFTGGLIAAAIVTVFGTVLAVVANPRDVVLAAIAIWGLALVGASAVSAIVVHTLPDSVRGWSRRGAVWGSFVVSLVLLGIAVIGPLFESLQPVWLVVLVGFVLSGVGVMVRRPHELAAQRVLINSAVISLFIGATMGGSVRTALMEKQVETIGVAADYLDTQVTSGVMLTWLGSILMILGAVGLWAKRRDQLEAVDRARRQREAAALSAKELGEELEARV